MATTKLKQFTTWHSVTRLRSSAPDFNHFKSGEVRYAIYNTLALHFEQLREEVKHVRKDHDYNKDIIDCNETIDSEVRRVSIYILNEIKRRTDELSYSTMISQTSNVPSTVELGNCILELEIHDDITNIDDESGIASGSLYYNINIYMTKLKDGNVPAGTNKYTTEIVRCNKSVPIEWVMSSK